MARVIVVGVDGSAAATQAVEWAADDAARAAVRLHIVHAVDRSPYEIGRFPALGLDDAAQRNADSVLAEAEAVARKRQPGLDITGMSLQGAAAAALRGHADGASEIVIGGRGLGGFPGAVLGSVSIHVAGHARGPVVVVRSGPDIVHGEVVVGLDDYRGCEPALAYAFEQASLRASTLRVVYAWQPPAHAHISEGAHDLEEIHAAQGRIAADLLQSWQRMYPQVPVIEDVQRNHPVGALTAASEKADLVVVGSQGRGAIGMVMLGSVTLGVLYHAHSSVTVVRA